MELNIKNKDMKKVVILTVATLLAGSVYAGGYRISMQGQRQLAMGHTGVAVINNNAESIFFNPANGVFLEDRFSFSAGVSALMANTKFQNSTYNWTNSSKNLGTPFYFYANYKISDRLAAGLAVYTPYGSAVDWDTDWEGSHLVNNIDLKAFFIQPTVSYMINDYVSVGAGLIYVNGGVEFNRNLSRSMTDSNGNRSDVTLDAKGVSAWGYNLGLTAKLDDYVTFGINYRSHIDMEVENGEANFSDLPGFLEPTYAGTTFSASMPLPAELSFGFSYQINEQWLAAIEMNHTYWRKYESLDIEFSNGTNSINPRRYKNSNTYRVGVQYQPTEKLSLRAGGYYDETPVRDGYFAPETPRNSSLAGTLGFTYQVTPKLGVDVSASFMHFDEFEGSYDYYYEDGLPVSFGGTYRSAVSSVGLGLSYNF